MKIRIIESGYRWFGLRHGVYEVKMYVMINTEIREHIVEESYSLGKLMEVADLLVITPKYTRIMVDTRVYKLYDDYTKKMGVDYPIYTYNHTNDTLYIDPTSDIDRFKRYKLTVRYEGSNFIERRIFDNGKRTILYNNLESGSYSRLMYLGKRFEHTLCYNNVLERYIQTKLEELYEVRDLSSGVLIAKYHTYKGVLMEHYRASRRIIEDQRDMMYT
jgi:hypothetical protein